MNLTFISLLCLHAVLFAVGAPIVSHDTVTEVGLKCGDQGDCLTLSPECKDPCGCDNLYFMRDGRCILNLSYLKEIMTEKYRTEEKLRAEADRIYGGIIISVIIFGACNVICALTACIYCGHINYSDRKLRKDVKALAHKLHRDGKLIKEKRNKSVEPKAESCNVVVEDAGVFVC